jgi:hypothetical protein
VQFLEKDAPLTEEVKYIFPNIELITSFLSFLQLAYCSVQFLEKDSCLTEEVKKIHLQGEISGSGVGA